MKWFTVFAVVVVCVALLPSVRAGEYYVSMTGSDGNDGSAQSNAWATIQHAVDNISPGDTITVLAGTYVGCRITVSGTESEPITLRAAPGATVVLNTVSSVATHGSIVDFDSGSDVGVGYWTIDGFEITGAAKSGIALFGYNGARHHHIYITDNHVHDNGLTGIFVAFSDDVLVESNTVADNGEHGVYISNSSNRPRILRNTLDGNTASGAHFNGDASMGGTGIITDAIVEENVIHDNGMGGGSGINMDGVVGGRIVNNLLYNEIASGISLYDGDASDASQNIDVLNNTIVLGISIYSGRWAINIPDSHAVSNRIYNNVLYTYHYWRGAISVNTPIPEGFECDYNIVMDRFSIDNGANNNVDLSAWQALGYDQHSSVGVPSNLFVNAIGDDYHLFSNSPCVDAGVVLPSVGDDLESMQRPQGITHDVGCYEYPSDMHRLVATAHEGGSIVPEGAMLAAPGTNQSYAISASAGHRIANIVTDEGGGSETNHGAVESFTFVDIQSNHTIDAYFTNIYTVTPIAGAGGTILPINVSTVDIGGAVSFEVSAEEHWHINSVRLNDIHLGAFLGSNRLTAMTVDWSNITEDTTLEVDFEENVWEMAVPESWLALHYPESNDYEGVALTDTDTDATSAWEEYMAGTDPKSYESRFRVIEAHQTNGSNCIRWLGSSVGSPLPFRVYHASGLDGPSNTWMYDADVPKGDTGTNTWYDTNTSSEARFYRVTVGE